MVKKRKKKKNLTFKNIKYWNGQECKDSGTVKNTKKNYGLECEKVPGNFKQI